MTENRGYVVDTNINGLFNVTKPVFKQMARQRGDKILNISSIGALRALPTSVHYAMTKAAVNGVYENAVCAKRPISCFG